jgi:Domain of unknown function (DUF4313)
MIDNSDEWWASVDEHWPNLLAILKRVGVPAEAQEAAARLKDARDPALADHFQRAWERAADSDRIHSWPAWSALCDLCSERDVLIEQRAPEGPQVVFKDWVCSVQKHQYDNGRLALQLVDAVDGDPIARATVNLPNEQIAEGEIFVKNHSENEGMLQALQQAGIVEPTGRMVVSGFVKVPVAKVLI